MSNKIRAIKSRALSSVSAAALLLTGVIAGGSTAHAQAPQTQQAQQSQQAAPLEEVTVTATRVVRDGYEAPTPITVISVEQIEAAAMSTVSDFVNQLPAVAGSTSTRTGNGGSSGGNGSISSINLRALGPNRTLVLLDGHRVVGASFNGAPDVSQFPQALISRVDIVTGGASAAWGSDAVSGVVNFVLDKKYVGIKGEVLGGVTSYGDDRQDKITLTAGTTFANDRGHFLVSGEYGFNAGISSARARPWYDGWKIVPYSIAGTPAGTAQNRVLPKVALTSSGPGGIITSGPLKGTAFGPGGVPYNYRYGPFTLDPFTSGGDWATSDIGYFSSLDDRLRKQTIFTRASYDLTDDINVWAESSYGNVHTNYNCCAEFNRNYTIKSDNAYLPAAVATAMAANNLAAVVVSTWLADIGPVEVKNIRTMKRAAFGLDGKFGNGWTWNAYATRGVNLISNKAGVESITANAILASDAVRNANGAIVCRSTLTNPTNGCSPMNVMGTGVITDAAKGFVVGQPELHTKQTQDVLSASIQGEPFSLPAGPISLAAGIEYRKESAVGKNEGPISTANGYFSGNFKATQGSYHDFEGFVEGVVPLAKDESWARSLELNAAVRATDYSLAGYVTTWKTGLTYQPIDDIRFRGTLSRDIRAPNLLDLFLAGQTNTQNVIDQFAPFAGQTFTVARRTFGNVNLKPEKADTTGLGVVLQPQWLPGLSASFDYYAINIKGAIATPANQIIMDYCFQGVTDLCQYIIRNTAGQVIQINGLPVNIASQKTRGFDIEASYRAPLDDLISGWSGNLMLRALGTHIISNKLDQFRVITENAGANTGSSINWRWLLTFAYDNGPFATTLTSRMISSGVYSKENIECQTSCPAPTTLRPTIDNNQIAGATYFDVSASYVVTPGDSGVETQVFLKIDNVINKDPAIVAAGGNINFINNGTNPAIYDILGRVFRAGVRFKM